MGNDPHSSSRCGLPAVLNNARDNLWNGVCHAAGPMYAPQGIKKSISVLHALIRVGSHSVTQKKFVAACAGRTETWQGRW